MPARPQLGTFQTLRGRSLPWRSPLPTSPRLPLPRFSPLCISFPKAHVLPSGSWVGSEERTEVTDREGSVGQGTAPRAWPGTERGGHPLTRTPSAAAQARPSLQAARTPEGWVPGQGLITGLPR